MILKSALMQGDIINYYYSKYPQKKRNSICIGWLNHWITLVCDF
ncbi:hypothetical protein MuYL_0764 [Mucilaginibacter xinganensis]|uniref:Uncharacterized protein n=1 Tax=Mucilaginibacter xinganensis TaxID=1234841 RepID=A0A223NSK2_9SPHI|nr:hypothetical protein MuYL_0764 [Mucilaginibacter xinganensis]